MSSRILQESSDLLLTEASEPIINENFIATDGIITSSPSVATTNISQDHNSSPANISTGNSVLATTAITQGHSLNSASVATNPPDLATTSVSQDHNLTLTVIVSSQVVISTAGLTQGHSLQVNSIVTGSPVVPSATATEAENFSVTSLVTGTPSLGQTTLTQAHSLTAGNIITPFPELESADDPNAVVIQETQEIEQMLGGWSRRAYEVPDGKLVQAEREIQQTYGDKVSIDRKAKSLIKFGRSAQLSINTLETVWTVGGNESYVTDNTISFVSSSSASDTQQITIEGHTLADNKFTFVIQTVTLNGQNAVPLTTDLARVSRMYNNNSTELVGRVVVYENTTISGGIPTDATKIHIDIPQGFQQSFKAATTFSNTDYYIMTGFYGAVSSKVSAAVDFYVEVRDVGKVFLPKGCFTASSTGGNSDIILDPAIIVPKNADIRIRAETPTNNAVVFGIFKGYIAKVL